MRRAVMLGLGICALVCAGAARAGLSAQEGFNRLEEIGDGGFVKEWLVSSPLPSEVDAGAYENFQHAGDWRAAATTRAGYEFNNPLVARQAGVHAGELPPTHGFLSVGADSVVLSALKLAGNPRATFRAGEGEGVRRLVARFYEADGRDAEATFTFDGALSGVRRADLLEAEGEAIAADGGRFTARLDGFGIETFVMDLSTGQGTRQPAIDGPSSAHASGQTAEAVQPVYSRYWLHNAVAAPLGNDPLKLSVHPVEQLGALTSFAYEDPYKQGGTTTTALRVSLVNNYRDRRARGEVAIEVAPGWRVVPERFAYDVEPGGHATRDVVLVTYPVKQGDSWARASGLVKARTEQEGQTLQDVLEIGRPLRLGWSVERTGRGVEVRVRNENRQRVEGALSLIAPLEAWAGERHALASLSPREHGFALAPGEEAVLVFDAPAGLGGAWAVARIAYNGFVEYRRADGVAPSTRVR